RRAPGATVPGHARGGLRLALRLRLLPAAGGNAPALGRTHLDPRSFARASLGLVATGHRQGLPATRHGADRLRLERLDELRPTRDAADRRTGTRALVRTGVWRPWPGDDHRRRGIAGRGAVRRSRRTRRLSALRSALGGQAARFPG